jgi:tetratricopeptide (TPR) repeat protein
VADRTAGTEWSLRALSRAQEAQARYKASQDDKDQTEPRTEDEKLIREGNKLFRMEKYTQALEKYRAAQKINNSLAVQQRIGHAFLEMGYEARDEYARQYLPLVRQYNQAARRGDRRVLAYLRRKAAAMVKRLRPLEQKAIQHYKSAEKAFRQGLKIAEGRDLDCEAHLAILEFQRKKRKNARRQLGTVLRKYKPGNDEERTVFEYCKSLLKYIRL